MPTTEGLDAITPDSLHASQATKWTFGPDTIGAFTAEMDYGVAPEIIERLREYIESQLFGYTPATFVTQMQQAVAGFMATQYGWDCPAERIFPVADVIVALEMALKHFSGGTGKAIVPTPAYMPFVAVGALFGYETVEVPMLVDDEGAYSYDYEAIDAASADGAGLFIHCDPHNPTGRVFTEDELRRLEAVVTAHAGRVFSDEIWGPLTPAGQRHIPYASLSEATAQHTVTATSASKSWNLPGLKAAQFITSNQADTDLWNEFGLLAMHGAATPGLVANTAAYAEGMAWLEDIRAYLQRNARDLVAFVREHMPDVRVPEPEATYVAWLDFRAYRLEPSPAEFFIEKAGVHLTQGCACGEVGHGFARFTFGMPHPIMMEALQRMARALADAPRADAP